MFQDEKEGSSASHGRFIRPGEVRLGGEGEEQVEGRWVHLGVTGASGCAFRPR